jgi:hypothetical protein
MDTFICAYCKEIFWYDPSQDEKEDNNSLCDGCADQ